MLTRREPNIFDSFRNISSLFVQGEASEEEDTNRSRNDGRKRKSSSEAAIIAEHLKKDDKERAMTKDKKPMDEMVSTDENSVTDTTITDL
jgi:myosin-crossreactive antigen